MRRNRWNVASEYIVTDHGYFWSTQVGMVKVSSNCPSIIMCLTSSKERKSVLFFFFNHITPAKGTAGTKNWHICYGNRRNYNVVVENGATRSECIPRCTYKSTLYERMEYVRQDRRVMSQVMGQDHWFIDFYWRVNMKELPVCANSSSGRG